MNFEKDIFISYAHIDNLSLKDGEHGWVENFHRALEVRLSQLIGEKPDIWRDQKLRGNDFFSDEIVEQFPKTALMISILSPRYIKSEWCIKEVSEFTQAAEKGIGTKVGNKSRILKVIKTAVPYNAHPREIADTLGYEFYIIDPQTGRAKELSQKVTSELEHIYWAKLDDIAYDICRLLEKVKYTGEGGVITREEPAGQLTVYLAETGSDLKEQHDMIKRELLEMGYRVAPDSRMPFVDSEFRESVARALDQSVLSIHLVGGSYGMVPEGSKSSILALQNELAAEKSKTADLHRLIWLLPDSHPDDDCQEQFIQRLRTDDDAQLGADLFETSIEDFRYAIRDKLKELESAAAAAKDIPPTQREDRVFLAETNYHLETRRESIKQKLLAQGYRVLPEQPLPLVHNELTETVDRLLDQCGFSIHLVGEGYGLVPEKTDLSIIHIQYERAHQKNKKGELKSFIRLSPAFDETDERQRSFVEEIKANMNAGPDEDIFEAADQDIEPLIFEKLTQIEEEKRKKREAEKEAAKEITPGPAEEVDKGPPLVYLVCDRLDADNISELEDFLFDSGCEVMIPAFEGEEDELIADHHENLKSCDAVVIYYGQGNELWMRSVTRDLTKIAGYGRTRPLELKAVFLAAPGSKQKKRFRSHGTIMIDGINGFTPGLMEPFTGKLRKS